MSSRTRFRSVLVLAAGLLASGGVAMAQQPAAPPANPDTVVAKVNDVPIRMTDVLALVETLPDQYRQLPMQMLFEPLLNQLIDYKVVGIAGAADKLADDPEVKRRVAQYVERIIYQTYIDRKTADIVTEKAMRERFAQTQKDAPAREEVRARHILTETEAQANQVLADLKRGADFAALAKAKSIDPGGQQQGGDLGYFTKEQMVPEFSDAAFAMKVGEVSSKPVKSQFGWHVIKVEDKRSSSGPAFEEQKEEIAAELRREATGLLLEMMRQSARVERFNPDGSPKK
jgi:peptidyl-prolyl cis-trans isomerase C